MRIIFVPVLKRKIYIFVPIFVSGSSQLLIKRQARESLGGRIKLFLIDPLSYGEWLALNKKEIPLKKVDIHQEELQKFFFWFARTPFPEIATLREPFLINQYITEMIVSKALSYDLPKIFKEADLELLETLQHLFFQQPGYILNFDSLAKDLGRRKETIRNHVFFMEQAQLIRILKNYRGSLTSSSRKLRRVYPSHPALTVGLREDIFIENLFVSLLKSDFYWREGNQEVDIIKSGLPVEIKWQEKIGREETKHLFSFLKKFKKQQGYIICKEEKEFSEGNKKISAYPYWKAAFLVQEEIFS